MVLSVLSIALLTSCGKKNSSSDKGSTENPVKIGVVGAADEQWTIFKEKASNEGINVDIVDCQDYTSENPALSQSQLDMNLFQHILYLANYNIENNDDLQPIGASAIFPIGLYSSTAKNYKKYEQIPNGAKIAIPNDDTNQARAISLLASINLVTLKDSNTFLPSPADVDTNKSKVEVVPIKAEQTPNALKDPTISAAVINNDFIGDAGVDFDDAIYKEDGKSKGAEPFINIFVVKKMDVDNPVYNKLVEIFHNEDVLKALQEKSGNTAIIVDNSKENLQNILKNLENDIKSNE